jgi:hypothetical protein
MKMKWLGNRKLKKAALRAAELKKLEDLKASKNWKYFAPFLGESVERLSIWDHIWTWTIGLLLYPFHKIIFRAIFNKITLG